MGPVELRGGLGISGRYGPLNVNGGLARGVFYEWGVQFSIPGRFAQIVAGAISFGVGALRLEDGALPFIDYTHVTGARLARGSVTILTAEQDCVTFAPRSTVGFAAVRSILEANVPCAPVATTAFDPLVGWDRLVRRSFTRP